MSAEQSTAAAKEGAKPQPWFAWNSSKHRYAPAMETAPWAKLTIPEPRYTRIAPWASKVYAAPAPSPRMQNCRNRVTALLSFSSRESEQGGGPRVQILRTSDCLRATRCCSTARGRAGTWQAGEGVEQLRPARLGSRPTVRDPVHRGARNVLENRAQAARRLIDPR